MHLHVPALSALSSAGDSTPLHEAEIQHWSSAYLALQLRRIIAMPPYSCRLQCRHLLVAVLLWSVMFDGKAQL